MGGLVLESTFTSAVRTVTRIPLFPVDRFRNIDKIGAVTAPILVIHGTDDRIVPYRLGEALYVAAPSPKRLLRVEQAGHYDLRERAGERFWQAYDTFIPGRRTAVPELHRDDASFRSGK